MNKKDANLLNYSPTRIWWYLVSVLSTVYLKTAVANSHISQTCNLHKLYKHTNTT